MRFRLIVCFFLLFSICRRLFLYRLFFKKYFWYFLLVVVFSLSLSFESKKKIDSHSIRFAITKIISFRDVLKSEKKMKKTNVGLFDRYGLFMLKKPTKQFFFRYEISLSKTDNFICLMRAVASLESPNRNCLFIAQNDLRWLWSANRLIDEIKTPINYIDVFSVFNCSVCI